MNVLSMFDGMGSGRLALDRLGVKVDNYFAYETDRFAVQIANKNFPDIQQMGDVMGENYPDCKIDLLIGGSPCQGFSRIGTKKNFDDPRSKLFYRFVEILDIYKPTYFLLENVVMKKAWEDVISSWMGTPPMKLNSKIVSAQNRERLYWTNIPREKIFPIFDREIMLSDIVLPYTFPVVLHNLYGGYGEDSVRVFTDKSPTIRTPKGGGHIPSVVMENLVHSKEALEYMNRKVADGRTHWDFNFHSDIRNPKSATMVANLFKGVPYNVFKDWNVIRKFHPIEVERLQTFPDSYTEGVSNTQRYKMLGNGWTVDLIVEIMKGMFA